MPRRLRLLLVGAPRAVRRMRDELTTSNVEVVGDVPDVAQIDPEMEPDVVLLGDRRWLDEIADVWQERAMPALIVTDRAREADVARLRPPGWAVVPADATVAELSAAIAAAAHGFALHAVSPAGNTDDGDDPLEIETLTAREREVLELLSEGLSNKGIATRLGISDQTVKFHVASIFGKLGVSSRTEAVRRGVQTGLITL